MTAKRKTAADRVKIGSGSCGGCGGFITNHFITLKSKPQQDKKRLSYQQRIRMYEAGKQLLLCQALDPAEYEAAVIALAKRCRV